jgi:cation diffusion facilitator CzcD-associated flavoprotein CzcO
MPAACPDEAPAERVEVLVLGAGMSGLAVGVALARAGIGPVVICERSAGVGGTWWDTRYPGAHVDVPSPLYAFGFAPNPRWSRRFAAAPEIQAYMQRVVKRFGLQPQLRLSTRLTQARFDEAEGRWHVRAEDGRAWRARLLVLSTGPLSIPKWPAIEGLPSFAGARLHSARWPEGGLAAHGAGRRVGVIGSGSTASQLVPPLFEAAAHGTLFQRTANWVLPRIDRPYGALDHALARVPPCAWAVRRAWYHLLEWGRRGFDEGTAARAGMQRTAARLRERQLKDPALRAAMTPTDPLGCKRIIYSSEFYPALARPNAEVVTAPILRIEPRGVVTAGAGGGERLHALDTLVCATGFETVNLLGGFAVQGEGGTTLAEAWGRAPRAWRGVCVPRFPNCFFMLGPNTGTGHTSTLLYIEPQAAFVVRAWQEMQRRGASRCGVREDATEAWDAGLQRRLEGSVWSACRSWYRNEAGRIVAIFPGFTREYVEGLDAIAGRRFDEAFEFG